MKVYVLTNKKSINSFHPRTLNDLKQQHGKRLRNVSRFEAIWKKICKQINFTYHLFFLLNNMGVKIPIKIRFCLKLLLTDWQWTLFASNVSFRRKNFFHSHEVSPLAKSIFELFAFDLIECLSFIHSFTTFWQQWMSERIFCSDPWPFMCSTLSGEHVPSGLGDFKRIFVKLNWKCGRFMEELWNSL